MAGLETFLEECRFFTAPWDEDEDEEDSEQRSTRRRSNRKSRDSKRSRRILAAACQSNWSSLDFVNRM